METIIRSVHWEGRRGPVLQEPFALFKTSLVNKSA